MIEAYSRERDGAVQLSANFKVREFACKDGSDPVFIDSELVALLQAIRDRLGRAVHINSGFRTASYNKAAGGAAHSQHLYGKAADIRADGVCVEELAACAEALLPDTGGVGRYPKAGFVHVDVRKPKSRWVG